MNIPPSTLFLLFHVHSSRSHDSQTTAQEYIDYLEKTLGPHEYAVLGLSDHNCIPLLIDQAIGFSTKKVLVIPGIQWKLKKPFYDTVIKFITRREILTFGNHDDLWKYIHERHHRVDKDGELKTNLTEHELLDYLDHKPHLMLVVPHPKHWVIDYYGKKQIEHLKKEVDERHIKAPFLVEELTGYDPFVRVLYTYKGKYLTIGGPDAHEIFSFLHTKSLFSVEASISSPDNQHILDAWSDVFKTKNQQQYLQTVDAIFRLIVEHNNEIFVKKHYLRALLHAFHSVPMFLKRRLHKFPHNLLK